MVFCVMLLSLTYIYLVSIPGLLILHKTKGETSESGSKLNLIILFYMINSLKNKIQTPDIGLESLVIQSYLPI